MSMSLVKDPQNKTRKFNHLFSYLPILIPIGYNIIIYNSDF